MIWVFYVLLLSVELNRVYFILTSIINIGWNVRYNITLGWNEIAVNLKKKKKGLNLCYLILAIFFGACCRALPAGLFTHFKFWACFHQHTGWKTFAPPPPERSQMWWKIQVVDIHLMHYAFHVLSRVTVGRVWHYWNNKKEKVDTNIHEEKSTRLSRKSADMEGKKYKSCSIMCVNAHQQSDQCQIDERPRSW